jgi:hypothetical protein
LGHGSLGGLLVGRQLLLGGGSLAAQDMELSKVLGLCGANQDGVGLAAGQGIGTVRTGKERHRPTAGAHILVQSLQPEQAERVLDPLIDSRHLGLGGAQLTGDLVGMEAGLIELLSHPVQMAGLLTQGCRDAGCPALQIGNARGGR